jgi:positive phototaxis protein PixI
VSSLSTTDRLKDLLPQLFSEQQRQGNNYLRFQLTKEINVLLDLSYVQESITIDSSQITSIPNLPEYVMGLMSSRNQVFLALDFAHLAGFPPETLNQREYQTIVVRVRSGQNNMQTDEFDLYGLTVKRIQGVSRILPEEFNTSTVISPDILRPFIQGSIQESQDDSSELQYSFLIDLGRLINTQITAISN